MVQSKIYLHKMICELLRLLLLLICIPFINSGGFLKYIPSTKYWNVKPSNNRLIELNVYLIYIKPCNYLFKANI